MCVVFFSSSSAKWSQFFHVLLFAESFFSRLSVCSSDLKRHFWTVDKVLHHLVILSFPLAWPTFPIPCSACANASHSCSPVSFICLYSVIFSPSGHRVWEALPFLSPFVCLLIYTNDLCPVSLMTSCFLCFSGRHPAANDCSRPSGCLWLLWALQPGLWSAFTRPASEPGPQHRWICE